MLDTSDKPAEQAPGRNWLQGILHYAGCRGVRGSVVIALAILYFDAVLCGSYSMSLLTCPVWFVLSAAKSAETRPGWRLALIRIAFPVVTLLVVLINDDIQTAAAEAHAEAIVAACEQFRAASGRYPHTLDELVPRYMPSVPHAKSCALYGKFFYYPESSMLFWYSFPPVGRRVYDFKQRRWSYIE